MNTCSLIKKHILDGILISADTEAFVTIEQLFFKTLVGKINPFKSNENAHIRSVISSDGYFTYITLQWH